MLPQTRFFKKDESFQGLGQSSLETGKEVYVEQEEFLTAQEQEEEYPEEDAWNLEEEFLYYDQEEDVSPFYLF